MAIDNAKVEDAARKACIALGLDPDERVGCGYLDCMTDFELAEARGKPVADVWMFEPRWCLMRRDAARHIALSEAANT
jgi:hypothetical protein